MWYCVILRCLNVLLKDHRMIVRVDSWESTSLYPNGHGVRVLGKAGEVETEVQTILMENCIHVPPFSEAQVSSTWIVKRLSS